MGVTPIKGGPIPRYNLLEGEMTRCSGGRHNRISQTLVVIAAQEKETSLACNLPPDTIGFDGLLDDIETTSVGAFGRGLETCLGKIEGVPDKHAASTTETTREERFDGGSGLLLLLKLLVRNIGGCLVVGHLDDVVR